MTESQKVLKSPKDLRADLQMKHRRVDERWATAKTGMAIAENNPGNDLRSKLNELIAGLKHVKHQQDITAENPNSSLPLNSGIDDQRILT